MKLSINLFILEKETKQLLKLKKTVQCLDGSEDALLFSSGMSALTTSRDFLQTETTLHTKFNILRNCNYFDEICSRRGMSYQVCGDLIKSTNI